MFRVASCLTASHVLPSLISVHSPKLYTKFGRFCWFAYFLYLFLINSCFIKEKKYPKTFRYNLGLCTANSKRKINELDKA